MASKFVLLLAVLAFSSMAVSATDRSQLQDFCVFDKNSPVVLNGLPCKNPMNVTPDDFLFRGLDKPGQLNNMGSAVTPVFAQQLPGLNTLGIGVARIDFAPGGLVAPHYHPRATEVLTLLEGTLCVGFIDGTGKLFAKILQKGDVYVFPQGLIHFQFNPAPFPALSLSGLSSQNPGVITVAKTVFGANPPISDDVLAKAFMLDKSTVDRLQAQFMM